MNVGGSATGAIFDAIIWILTGLQWIVIIAALVSWVSPDPRNPDRALPVGGDGADLPALPDASFRRRAREASTSRRCSSC